MLGHVGAQSGAEGVLAEVLLQHPQNGTPFLVGEGVEHGLGLFWPADRELDRPRRRRAVDLHGEIAGKTKGDPAFPLGPG